MRLTVLGSGGNTPIPTPTCRCAVCMQAREEGLPYTRGGNSLYLPGLAAMVDAPEFAFRALNREDVDDIEYILLTHWHPDHVNGLRLVQSRDMSAHDSLLTAIATNQPTIVTTPPVYERIQDVFGQIEHFRNQGFCDVHLLEDSLEIGPATVSPIPYALDGDSETADATAFVIEEGGRTVLIASDDARHLEESALPEAIDLAVFECGLFESGPDGETLFSDADWSFLSGELTHSEVLDRIDRVDPDRTLLTEIEHLTARSYDQFETLERRDAYDGIQFATDGLTVEVE